MTMAKIDPNDRRDELIATYSASIGEAATFTGDAWDTAVDSVLGIMIQDGRAPIDAISLYRARNIDRVRQSVRTVTTHTVTSFRVPKAVLDLALDLAGGDITRLRLDPDGSVTVVNQGKAER